MEGHGKIIEKTLPGQSCLECRAVLSIVTFGEKTTKDSNHIFSFEFL